MLNLKKDPFPLAEGLQKIDKEIYEQIIVRTEIFERFVSYAERIPDQLFKNTIFYGDFGSGKTAFFDYFKEILLRNKILLVDVALWAVADVETNIHKFEEELICRLRESCDFFKMHVNEIPNTNHLQVIRNIFSELTKQRGFRGFVVVVDDLHKNTKVFEAVIDFLSYLQIFTSNLIKGTDFNLGLYVAGIPSWLDKTSSDPRLSGSLIREEKFPVISELDAYNMLNKRLITFSKNPERKNIIGKSFVKQVYETLHKNNQSITFRAFLRKALEEFRNGNFDILTVNPKAIPTSTLESIKEKILGNPRLNYQFEELLSRTSTRQAENKQKCFELLGVAYIESGVFEDTQQAERNKWAFQQLERCGLIHLTTQNGRIKWIVSKDLVEINKQIVSTYNVSMEEYLIRSCKYKHHS